MNKDFFYQIKAKLSEPETSLYGGIQNWAFPPVFSGKVTACDKKEAKKLIEEDYGRVFPLRVLAKDLASSEFLLNIEEIKPGSRIEDLFELKKCEHCPKTFYVIDHYNNANESYKGSQYCSSKCKNDAAGVREYIRSQFQELSGSENPLIYKIHNRITNMCYIGKTTQIFTLRWYQHFFQGGNNKFHNAIQSSKVTDWLFEIQEIVTIPEDIKTVTEIEKLVIERERFWINHHNSIENGYNSKT